MTHEPPTFESAVYLCWNNAEFMHHYRRLRGVSLGLDNRTPIDKAIDAACGHEPKLDDEEFNEFFRFIRDRIWMPAVMDCLKEQN